MSNSSTSRIFFVFSGLILVSFCFLSYFFAHNYIEQFETQILDNLSSRIEAYALKNEDQLKTGKLPQGSPFVIIAADNRRFQNLLPPDGNIVTSCPYSEQASYCAIQKIEGSPYWILLRLPRPSWFDFLGQFAKELSISLLLLLLLCFGLAWTLSRILMNPLRKFVKASQMLAEGDYNNPKLPEERSDEVGLLARSFGKMLKQVQAREHQIAEAGVKLAHSARLASLGQLGAGVAHEVKNPLMALKGHARILKESAKDPESIETAELIMKESERCNQILQQMLRFSRNDPHEKKSFLLNDIIQSTNLLIKAEAKKRGVQIELDSQSEGVAHANPQQVQQVLLNLIINALQASERGSSVKIESRDSSSTEVMLAVQDSGEGIPKSIQEKVFQPFFTTKDKTEGSGLGLSLAAQFIEEQGGRISLESSEGQGTRFEIYLPRDA